MATWEDGPEYAPVERPADFSVPDVPPLDLAPPYAQMAAFAPKERPQFGDPPVPVAPLATLVPVVADVRDPHRPFDVVSSALTSDPSSTDFAWGAARWSPPPTTAGPSGVFGTGPTAVAVLTPAAGPWGPPTGPAFPPPGIPPSSGGFPTPGTPEWFGPGAYGEHPVTPPGGVSARQVFAAATPGLLIVLGIGALLYPLSPIMVAVALGLSSRVRVAQPRLRYAFVAGIGWVFFFGVVGALTGDGDFSSWWHFVGLWSLLACWVLLILTPIVIYRTLRSGQAPQPRRATWG